MSCTDLDEALTLMKVSLCHTYSNCGCIQGDTPAWPASSALRIVGDIQGSSSHGDYLLMCNMPFILVFEIYYSPET